MNIRILDGPGSPWEGSAIVDSIGMVIDGEGYCPLDDAGGMIIVSITDSERRGLLDHGFQLAMEQ